MKKAIVCTTVNPPTKALKNFMAACKKEGWRLFIVGDQRSPHEDYITLDQGYDYVTYLSPEKQEEISKKLSDLIGWNCIQRRNFGFIAAYRWGAEVIATVDDDNIPCEKWGKNVKVGEFREVLTYDTKTELFDPLSPIYPHLWHRGFPIQLLDERKISFQKLVKRHVLVQADLWDGDPDIDAVCRITLAPQVKDVATVTPYTSNKMMPFNSQNTFLHRDCFPTYFLFPHIGRMDDIWASYYLQSRFPNSNVVFAKASVYQERNEHDLTKDLENEMIGYKHSLEFARWCLSGSEEWPEFMPEESIKAFEVYRGLFDE